MLFLQGAGGYGKTYLYETLIHVLRGRNRSVIAVAWTGIAAINMTGGRTVTSTFCLPLDIDARATCKPILKDKIAFSDVDLII